MKASRKRPLTGSRSAPRIAASSASWKLPASAAAIVAEANQAISMYTVDQIQNDFGFSSGNARFSQLRRREVFSSG